MDDFDFIFGNMPFDEALQYFQSKTPITADEFKKLTKEAQARAFTVSEMAALDALDDLHSSIAKAIETGQTLADWKKNTRDILDQWDISGWRAETIYRTNLQTAYQVGRYEQMTDPDVLEMRPNWMYVAVMDERTRPEHAALNGKVFPADDPFWNHWYPPNGYNCRCTVETLSDSEMDRDGLELSKGKDFYGKPVAFPDGTVGRLYPDAGWDFNPGKEGLQKAGLNA